MTRASVVTAVVVNAAGRLFAQRRSLGRTLFPGCWEMPGGHVEAEESAADALSRELLEECGWALAAIEGVVGEYHWTRSDGVLETEVVYLVKVEGALDAPQLEALKATEFRWVDERGLNIFLDGRAKGDTLVYQSALDAFAFLRRSSQITK